MNLKTLLFLLLIDLTITVELFDLFCFPKLTFSHLNVFFSHIISAKKLCDIVFAFVGRL